MAIEEGNDPPMVDAILVEEEPAVYAVGSRPARSDAIPTAVAIISDDVATSGPTSIRTTQGRWTASSARTYQGDSFVATTTYYLPVPHESETISMSPPPNLGRYPCRISCPYCHQETLTKTRDQVDSFTICMTIALFFIFWPLFWLPLVCPSCKTTKHFCEYCDVLVGESSEHCQCCR